MPDYLLRNIADGSMQVVTGTVPFDLAGAVDPAEYKVRAISPEAATSLIVPSAAGFDFTQAPALAPTSGVSAAAVTGGWDISFNSSVSGGRASWNVTSFLTGSDFTFSFDILGDADFALSDLHVIMASNEQLTSIRDLDQALALTAGVSQNLSFTLPPTTGEARYLGFRYDGPSGAARGFQVTNLSMAAAA